MSNKIDITHTTPSHLITIVDVASPGVFGLSVHLSVVFSSIFSVGRGVLGNSLQNVFPTTVRSLQLKYHTSSQTLQNETHIPKC
jgi:hypothetical protein